MNRVFYFNRLFSSFSPFHSICHDLLRHVFIISRVMSPILVTLCHLCCAMKM